MRAKKKTKPLVHFFVILILAYLILTIVLSPSHTTTAHYHLSSTALRFLDLTIILPVVGIWSAGYYGFSKIREYSHTINKTRDGQHMRKLAIGFGILAFAQPAAAILSTILNHAADSNSGLLPTTTVINNYISLAIPLVAFLFIGEAAKGLREIVKYRYAQRSVYIFALCFILVVVGYCYFVFNSLPSISHLAITAKQPIYYLPKWLIIFTIVIPYIFVWFIGVLAAGDIYAYNHKIKGLVYKNGVGLLALGTAFIIFASILLQYLVTLSARLLQLKLTPILVIIYPLLIVISIGYILVALGAKKLQRIEEV